METFHRILFGKVVLFIDYSTIITVLLTLVEKRTALFFFVLGGIIMVFRIIYAINKSDIQYVERKIKDQQLENEKNLAEIIESDKELLRKVKEEFIKNGITN